MIDLFVVVGLIGGLLLTVFLILSAVFFNSTMNNQLPSSSQSSFMFWLSVVWGVLLIGFAIWAFIKLFNHKEKTCGCDVKPIPMPVKKVCPSPVQYPQQNIQARPPPPPNPSPTTYGQMLVPSGNPTQGFSPQNLPQNGYGNQSYK
jgi:hypothetical protein